MTKNGFENHHFAVVEVFFGTLRLALPRVYSPSCKSVRQRANRFCDSSALPSEMALPYPRRNFRRKFFGEQTFISRENRAKSSYAKGSTKFPDASIDFPVSFSCIFGVPWTSRGNQCRALLLCVTLREDQEIQKYIGSLFIERRGSSLSRERVHG